MCMSEMASKLDTDVAMEEDTAMSETEDGELTEEFPELATPIQVQSKLQLRAKRFGIIPNDAIKISHPDKRIDKLYTSMRVNSKSRLEAIHMFGIDNMNTQDIFAYFESHPPVSVEWINDKTCNVVWLDEKLCATALLGTSVKIKNQSGEAETKEADESSDDEEFILMEDLRLALPPGIWRKGISKQFAPNIFLRFATVNDRESDRFLLYSSDYPSKNMVFPDEGDEKISRVNHESDNPWSDIARHWGHFEQRVCGAKSRASLRDARELIKKKAKETPVVRDAREILLSERQPQPKNSMKNSRLMGKMHADMEEKKLLERLSLRKPKKRLSEVDLRQRLGHKRSKPSNGSSRLRESSDEEESRIEIDSISRDMLREGSWASYESGQSSDDSENEPMSSDLRHKLQRNSKPFTPRSPLRIEIDNDIYYSGNANDSSSS